MPHLVSSFLRSSSGNISHIKKSATARSSRASSRNPSASTSPDASDSEDHVSHHHHPVKMLSEPGDSFRKHHRLSLPFGRSRHDSHHHSSGGAHASSQAPATMNWSIESPPVVLYGPPEESTGALLSGLVYIDVRGEALEVDGFVASLTMYTRYRKPFQTNCSDCQTRATELQTWRFLAQPTRLRRGNHQFPFSSLLAGTLPASVDTPLVSISYHFKAEAVVTAPPQSPGPGPQTLTFERTLNVKRSLPEPLFPHHSVRIFPPTNIKASAHYAPIIHPAGTNNVTLRLDGLMTHNEKVKTVDLWKLRKVSWKLEETIKTPAPACGKHAPSQPPPAQSGGGGGADGDGTATTGPESESSPLKVFRTETRVLGEKQLLDGWKSDFSGADGVVDLEFDYALSKTHAKDGSPRFACDMQTDDGTQVSHALQIELIVSKEFAPEGKPQLASQTGTGRILRMHFAVSMTEYPGLGVSWDNEAPPVYQDVPPSPPGYPTEPPIEYGELEALDAQRQESGAAETGSRRPSASERSFT